MSERLDDDYVCANVCSGCPFRKTGVKAVRLQAFSANRIVGDLLHDKMFPCHETTHPEGLSDQLPIADRADWRFCAGAYLAMSEDQRMANLTLRTMRGLGYHNPDTPPAGEKVVFESLDQFQKFYQ